MVIAFSREITNLDYHYGTKTEYLILGDMIDDSLFYVENENLTYAPSLASDFNVVDDVTLDVNLRQGVKFHDGSEMTSDDVVYTYNFIVTNEKNRRHKKLVSWLKSIEKTLSKLIGSYGLLIINKSENNKIYCAHSSSYIGGKSKVGRLALGFRTPLVRI